MTFITLFSSSYIFCCLSFFVVKKHLTTFIASFYSSYFFYCFGFLWSKSILFFSCIPNRDTWLLLDYVIVFVICVYNYNILFD